VRLKQFNQVCKVLNLPLRTSRNVSWDSAWLTGFFAKGTEVPEGTFAEGACQRRLRCLKVPSPKALLLVKKIHFY
jgi:hypothetical protein